MIDCEIMGFLGIFELIVVVEDGGKFFCNSIVFIIIKINDINDNVLEFCNDGQILEFIFNELDIKKDFYIVKVGLNIFLGFILVEINIIFICIFLLNVL